MHLKYNSYLNKGASAELFKVKPDRVLKLYKSHSHPDFQGTAQGEFSEEVHSQKIMASFQSEIKAYSKFAKNQSLKEYLPKYYGAKIIKSVTDKGDNISHFFELEKCLEIEFIQAEIELKLVDIFKSLRFECLPSELTKFVENKKFDLHQFQDEVRNIGWNHFIDSSVLFDEFTFKLFDFEFK